MFTLREPLIKYRMLPGKCFILPRTDSPTGEGLSRRLHTWGFARLCVSVCCLAWIHPLDAQAGGNPGTQLEPRLGRNLDGYQSSIVSPDGSGLPAGSGSVAAGKEVFRKHCAACHGPEGKMPGNALVGGRGSLATPQPLKTIGSYWPYATTLFDYIARSMPYDQPKSLSADETYGVVAYLLWLNGILDSDTNLDSKGLVKVEMPNQKGFIDLSAASE